MKCSRLVLMSCIAWLLLSCVSYPSLVDRGIYNPKNAAEADLVTLSIDKYLSIENLDGEFVSWNNRPPDAPVAAIAAQNVRISSGVHVFGVTYNDGDKYTIWPMTVIANFEPAKTYRLTSMIDGAKVKYDVIDDSNQSVVLDTAKLKGNKPDMLSMYIRSVLNPSMEEIGNTVKLENDTTLIVFKPDMIYFMTDKSTGTITEGRAGFVMDFAMKEGKIYLLQTDNSKMTRQQFIDSANYQETAQIVLVPVECDGKTVRYRYERPTDLKDSEVVFRITEIAK